MRRVALLSLVLALSGCGYRTWSSLPFMDRNNPNLPAGDSENMQRVRGEEPAVSRLTTEPGDIWPGPLPPAPTLKDLVSDQGVPSRPEQAVPGSPLSRGTAPSLPPNPAAGSSTPPELSNPNLATSNPAPPPPAHFAFPPVPPPPRGAAGRVIQTPSGPAVTTGGGPGYQTTTTPGGGQAIVVPNGNGTSTMIHSDGRIETVPAPK